MDDTQDRVGTIDEQLAQISGYERRIAGALSRIGEGLEAALVRAEREAAQAAASGLAAALAAADPGGSEPMQDAVAQAGAQEAFEAADPTDAALAAEPADWHSAGADPGQAAGPASADEDTRVSAQAYAALQDELETERALNAQLSERVRAIREKQETTLAAMERRFAQANRQLEEARAEVAQLSAANVDLVAANQGLIGQAPAASEVEAGLMAEVLALRAARQAEAQDLAAIVAGLEPLIAAHAPALSNSSTLPHSEEEGDHA